jgi:hypothetical protein
VDDEAGSGGVGRIGRAVGGRCVAGCGAVHEESAVRQD